MYLTQLILYFIFRIIFCENYDSKCVYIPCQNLINSTCAKGYTKHKNSETCRTSECNGPCNRNICKLVYCNIERNTTLDLNLVSKCQHFLCSNESENCNCYDNKKTNYLTTCDSDARICVCKRGYVVDLENMSDCLPYCCQKCENGKYSAPETCSCNPGYKLTSNKYKCSSQQCYSQCSKEFCNEKGECEHKNKTFLGKNNANVTCETQEINKTITLGLKCENCAKTMCTNVTIYDDSFHMKNKTMTFDLKCKNCTDNKCEKSRFICNKIFEINNKTNTCKLKCKNRTDDLCKDITINYTKSCNIENPTYTCDLICSNSKHKLPSNNTCSGNSSCEEMVHSIWKPILYIIPICAIAGLIFITVITIVIWKKLKQNTSSKSEGCPDENVQEKSSDEEMLENIELYGRF